MEENLIAPCGMNCALCISYQTEKADLNHKGFNKKSCPGCGGDICCHNGLCLICDLEKYRSNKSYRWNE